MSLLVEHINKSFGPFQAITDLSLEVKAGALFGFLGANGAGKTTTMRMILDIFCPDSGQIRWNGVPVNEVARRVWGYLPEERGLYPQMEVEDQLLFWRASMVSRRRTPSAHWTSGWTVSRLRPIATRRSRNCRRAISRKSSFWLPFCMIPTC